MHWALNCMTDVWLLGTAHPKVTVVRPKIVLTTLPSSSAWFLSQTNSGFLSPVVLFATCSSLHWFWASAWRTAYRWPFVKPWFMNTRPFTFQGITCVFIRLEKKLILLCRQLAASSHMRGHTVSQQLNGLIYSSECPLTPCVQICNSTSVSNSVFIDNKFIETA